MKGLDFVLYLSLGLMTTLMPSDCEKLRLVGPSRCSGRVEIFFRDEWGTICDDSWSLRNADVLCRELNCGTAIAAKGNAFFGQGKDSIWLDDVRCEGHEVSILKCIHNPLGQSNCNHGEDAGVICAENIRMANGSNRCQGRVEAYVDGRWKRVCQNEFGEAEAHVACKESGCGTAVAQSDDPYYGEGQLPDRVNAKCSRNETSLTECKIHESREDCRDAVVNCEFSKSIRLVNGTHSCSGRVEVHQNGEWGTVCDDRWGIQEGIVACREMNCGNPISVNYKSFFGSGEGNILLDDVECTGQEMFLSECPHNGLGEHNCDHNEDAGLICSENIRLTNGTDRCSGRLEVLHNNNWGKVCQNTWNAAAATIVCNELGCAPPKTSPLNFGDSELRAFKSSCSGNEKSITECSLQESPVKCEGVSLSCGGNLPLRLANGTDRCSGRVELMLSGVWGTVCDDDWDLNDAEVVCRALDCGTAQMAKSGAFFGEGQNDIWLDDVNCFGNETSILHCSHATLGQNNCGHGEDAGVVCTTSIKLVNGVNQCSGRVEIHHGDRWAPVYNVNWGRTEAQVVCREMNCGDAIMSAVTYGQKGESSGYTSSCSGSETSLTQCTLRPFIKTSQDRAEETSVTCTGSLKLVGGNNRCAGRVEFFDNNQWKTVCGHAWDMKAAAVACTQTNCGTVHKMTDTDEFGTGHTGIDQFECNGQESTLSQCRQIQVPGHTCNVTSVAGVVCSDSMEVRLHGGNNQCTGRVEVRHGEQWGTLCDAEWSMSKGEVVCQMLECGQAVKTPGGAEFGSGVGLVFQATDSCFGNVSFIQKCSRTGFTAANCGHERDAGLICAAQIRLAGSSTQCSGRVEVYHKGQWGTVCDDEWEKVDGDVVCRQLGCGHAMSAPRNAHFGSGSGPIWLDNVECSGQETALSQCQHPGFGENNCGHSEDASVICIGGLQKPHITLSPGSTVRWGEKIEITCNVATQQLGGTFVLKRTSGSFHMERTSESDSVIFTIPRADFSHKGEYFCEYSKKLNDENIIFPQGNTVELFVTVTLETPSISLTSPHAMVIFSPDKISLQKGTSFSITCSIHSRYPGGTFYLMMTNTSTADTKPAFGHTIFYLAYFEFPAVEYKDQGTYSCVYGINISSVSFTSSPSKTLQVSVVDSSDSSVIVGAICGVLLLLLAVIVAYVFWRRRRQGGPTTVHFSNRAGGAIKEMEDRNKGAFDGSFNIKEHKYTHGQEADDDDAASGNSVERISEDLVGKVCYEFEPLVHS